MSKHKQSPRIQNASQSVDPAYITWKGELADKPQVIQQINGALEEYRGIPSSKRARASSSSRYGFHHDYSDLASNVSGRPGLTRRESWLH